MDRATATQQKLQVPAGLEYRLQDVAPCDARETIRRGSALVSDKVGITKAIGHGIYRAQDPSTFSLGIVSTDLSRFAGIYNSGKAGGGGESLEIALAATIGEAAERYCMLFFDQRRMVFGSYRELSEYAVHPDELRLHSKEQIEQWRQTSRSKITYFDEDTKLSWCWGWSLTAEAPRLVPATLVYLEPGHLEAEESIGMNASSGLAAGQSLEAAILSGLYEVVERDAFTMCWLYQKVRRKIRIDDPEILERLTRSFHAADPKVRFDFYDITLDIPIPSVFAVTRRPTEMGPALCVSSVTRLSPRDAMRKVLREVGQALPYLRYLTSHVGDWNPKEDFSDLPTFDHHFLFYLKRPELVEQALAFCDVKEEVALSEMTDRSNGSIKRDIETCIELLRQAGREVIIVDITTPDVREAGFRVVRVVIPGLVPLHGDHSTHYLGVKRLHELPYQLGWNKDGWDPAAGLNKLPHPFP